MSCLRRPEDPTTDAEIASVLEQHGDERPSPGTTLPPPGESGAEGAPPGVAEGRHRAAAVARLPRLHGAHKRPRARMLRENPTTDATV